MRKAKNISAGLGGVCFVVRIRLRMDDLGIDDLRPAQSTHGGGGGQERGSLTRPHNASAKVEPGGFYLKFLQRDEWFALIPLQV